MNIMIVGAGKMGSLIEETAKKQNMNVVLKADKLTYPDLSSFTEPVDAVIDFSHPDNLDWVYDVHTSAVQPALPTNKFKRLKHLVNPFRLSFSLTFL